MNDDSSNPLGHPEIPILLKSSSFCSHLYNTSQLSIDLRTSIQLDNFDSPGSNHNPSKLGSPDNDSMFENFDVIQTHDQQASLGPSQSPSRNNPRLSTLHSRAESVELNQTQSPEKVDTQGRVYAPSDSLNSKWYGYQRKAKRKDSWDIL